MNHHSEVRLSMWWRWVLWAGCLVAAIPLLLMLCHHFRHIFAYVVTFVALNAVACAVWLPVRRHPRLRRAAEVALGVQLTLFLVGSIMLAQQLRNAWRARGAAQRAIEQFRLQEGERP